jgi:hypothetical protein
MGLENSIHFQFLSILTNRNVAHIQVQDFNTFYKILKIIVKKNQENDSKFSHQHIIEQNFI